MTAKQDVILLPFFWLGVPLALAGIFDRSGFRNFGFYKLCDVAHIERFEVLKGSGRQILESL